MKVIVITAMFPTADRPSWGTFVKEQVASLKNEGVDVEVFAFDGQGSALNYLKAGFALRGIVKKKDYDLVHAHYGLTGAAALMQSTVPVVITFHGSDLLGEVGSSKKYTFSGKIKTWISRWAAYNADGRIIVADVLKEKLGSLSSVTIPMGVDLSIFKPMNRFEAKTRLSFSTTKKYVLFVANPKNQVKRFDIASKAVSLLNERGINVELLPIYNIPHDQVPLYMNACDVLVLTSMHEASPCVIKEAMACNLPIVSVNVGDIAERIFGVEGCFLCERTPEDVSTKLRQALEFEFNLDNRSKVIELGLQNIAKQVMSYYENILFTSHQNFTPRE